MESVAPNLDQGNDHHTTLGSMVDLYTELVSDVVGSGGPTRGRGGGRLVLCLRQALHAFAGRRRDASGRQKRGGRRHRRVIAW